jgi:shikimate dehydrogenase
VQAVNAKTQLYILIGQPVKHSLSPQIHNAAFASLQLNAVYLACPVEPQSLPSALEGIRGLAISGANVTSPYKDAVIPLLDSLSSEAEKINSVNTIINRGGLLHGETTDGKGLCRALGDLLPAISDQWRLLVVGAGGAARAAAFSMANAGYKHFYVANRTVSKGQALADLLQQAGCGTQSYPLPLKQNEISAALHDCHVVVYTLPHDDPLFLAALQEVDSFQREKYFFDLRYNPAVSDVMKAFAKKGGRVFNGLGLLYWQAVYAFELFTGQQAPLEAMRRAAGYEYSRGG